MKVLEVNIESIRGINSLNWKLPAGQEAAGWHVILGENGSGKSTFLRALGLGLLGLDRTSALLLDYSKWIHHGTHEGEININIQPEDGDEPDTTDLNASALVLGVGDSGSSLVDYMYRQGIDKANFAVCNTNFLALEKSFVDNRILLPEKLHRLFSTSEVTKENVDPENKIRDLVIGAKVLFIVAGMGGATGTNASPAIAQIAKQLGLLVIGIITAPLSFEGKRRGEIAEKGIEKMHRYCDAVLTVRLDDIRSMYVGATLSTVFSTSDTSLWAATKNIVELCFTTGEINIDFEDVKAVLKDSGPFVVGTAIAKGENRAIHAIHDVFESPIFHNIDLANTKLTLLTITSGPEAGLEMDELSIITEHVQQRIGNEAEMIFGHATDNSLRNQIQITLLISSNDFTKERYSKDSIVHENTKAFVKNIEIAEKLEKDSIKRPYLLSLDLFNVSRSHSSLPRTITLALENGERTKFESIWGNGKGWFLAGFGPFRRFTGGDTEFETLTDFSQHRKLASCLSIFRESFAFTKSIEWLKQLKFRSLEKRGYKFFNLLFDFINQPGFLPNDTLLTDISSEGVFFINAPNAEGNVIGIEELSDGYRSVLSLAFELLRQLEMEYQEDTFSVSSSSSGDIVITVDVPGVVLIDEIDAHLHPIWQKNIGYWLTKHFPRIQFFVTTHSPLICQAAENGTVFHLPRPNSNEESGMVTGTELKRLIYGNVLEAYGTEVFGLITTQSQSGQEKTHRLTELNELALIRELSSIEQQERDVLRAILPISDSEDFINNLLSSL